MSPNCFQAVQSFERIAERYRRGRRREFAFAIYYSGFALGFSIWFWADDYLWSDALLSAMFALLAGLQTYMFRLSHVGLRRVKHAQWMLMQLDASETDERRMFWFDQLQADLRDP